MTARMEVEVLPQLVSSESHAGLTALKIWDLFARAARQITSSRLSDRETELLDSIRLIAAEVGPDVLAAADVSELDATLDSLVRLQSLSSALRDLAKRVADTLTLSTLEAASSVSPELVHVLGVGPAKKLEQVFPLVNVMLSALFQVLAANPSVLSGEQFAPSELLYDTDLPLRIRQCLLAAMRATVVNLAIGAALEKAQPLPPWKALALVDRLVEGEYERVRFLALLPWVQVPEAVLPAKDRLDITALDGANREGKLLIDTWLHDAEQSDADVFFPEGDGGFTRG